MFNYKFLFLIMTMLALAACGQPGPSNQAAHEMVGTALNEQSGVQNLKKEGLVNLEHQIGEREVLSDKEVQFNVTLKMIRSEKELGYAHRKMLEKAAMAAEMTSDKNGDIFNKILEAEPGDVVNRMQYIALFERSDDGWAMEKLQKAESSETSSS